MKNIIIDSDGGTDDAMALLLALGAPQHLNILGVTAVHGNVGINQAAANLSSVLAFAGRADIPVYKGAANNLDNSLTFDDNAHGEDGLGGVVLGQGAPLAQGEAHDFLIETLSNAKEKVTIVAIGPLTNIAPLICEERRHLVDKIEELVILGGANEVLNAKRERRYGNITEHAEFNFYKDALAANNVLYEAEHLGLKVTLLPMDAIQGRDQQVSPGFVMTPTREARIAAIRPELAQMATAAAWLDVPKFGAEGAFLFDPTTIAYLLYPEHFHVHDNVSMDVVASGKRAGHLILHEGVAESPLRYASHLTDINGLFNKCLWHWQTAVQKPVPQPRPRP